MPALVRKTTSDVEAPIPTNSELEEEQQNLVVPSPVEPTKQDQQKPSTLTKTGLRILILLALQNCGKNILMRFIMKEQPKFLHSTAVIVVELLKLSFAIIYIQFFELPQASKSVDTEERTYSGSNALISISRFVRDDWRNTMLLIVPAGAYSLQMSLEYVAFANIDAATFSVLVQTKMLTAALFFWIVLKKKLCKRQLMSLLILTSGVMLCSIKNGAADSTTKTDGGDEFVGILATIGIAISSGFASVYTEKVIKSERNNKVKKSLAHMQAQLAIVSLVILGFYAVSQDHKVIWEKGFFYMFNGPAFLSCLNSAIGGLIVAAVLKYADSVLKGYATASSVVLTGIISKILFGTSLSIFYGIGMVNVVCAVLLYNGAGLEDYIC